MLRLQKWIPVGAGGTFAGAGTCLLYTSYIMNYIMTFVFSLASAVLLGELFVRIPVLNVLFGLKKKDKKRDKKIIVPVDAPGK